jgi:signal transduction histidine kinase
VHGDPLRLAEEQGALRRVATAVAHGAAPADVFAVLAREFAQLLHVPLIEMVRFDPGATGFVVGAFGDHPFPVGTSWPLDVPSVMGAVYETGRPARIDDYPGLTGVVAEVATGARFRSAVGVPIVVAGRTWGVTIAITTGDDVLPEGTERRLADFTDLVAAAIANTEARAELLASRARIVTAADQGRAKLARDIHDGAQQRLVSAIVLLQLADQRLDADVAEARGLLRDALTHAQAGIDELRELAAGVHPSMLTNGGLRPAIEALAEHSRVPVRVLVEERRFPDHVEAGAYFLVAEAITNSAKHARATRVDVEIAGGDGVLEIDVRDDGVGGADPAGSGMRGLEDRVEALGGTFRLESPEGRGTAIHATLPLPG